MSQSNPRGAQPVKDLPFDPDSPPEVLQRLVGYGLTHRDKGTPPRLLSDVVLEIFLPSSRSARLYPGAARRTAASRRP